MCVSSANVVGKDLYPYEKTKDTHATEKNLKKQNFREAFDQIEAAARGQDSAPLDYEIPADASTLESTVDESLSKTVDETNEADVTAEVEDSFTTANNTTADAESGKLEPPAVSIKLLHTIAFENTHFQTKSIMASIYFYMYVAKDASNQ